MLPLDVKVSSCIFIRISHILSHKAIHNLRGVSASAWLERGPYGGNKENGLRYEVGKEYCPHTRDRWSWTAAQW